MSDCCTPTANQSNHFVVEGTAHCEISHCETADYEAGRAGTTPVQHCPACGTKGKRVGTETVKAMLAVTLHEIQSAGNYLFCASKDCDVVYFADDGEQTFTEGDLREQVYQKHPDDDAVFVCYCFRHTPGSIRAELLTTHQSTVVETVTKGTKTGQCACELRNPQGSCCLGNLSTVVRQVHQELHAVAIL